MFLQPISETSKPSDVRSGAHHRRLPSLAIPCTSIRSVQSSTNSTPPSAHGKSHSFSHFNYSGNDAPTSTQSRPFARRPLPPTPPTRPASPAASIASSSTSSHVVRPRPLPLTPDDILRKSGSASSQIPPLPRFSDYVGISQSPVIESPSWRQSVDSLDLALAPPSEETIHCRRIRKMVKLTRCLGECPPVEVVFGVDVEPGYISWEEVSEELEKEISGKRAWLLFDPPRFPTLASVESFPSQSSSSASSSTTSLIRPRTPNFLEPPLPHDRRAGWIKEVGKKKAVVEVADLTSVMQTLRTL